MSATRQAIIWLGVVFFFVATLFLLSEILLPFIVGALSAYLLDPLVDDLASPTCPYDAVWANASRCPSMGSSRSCTPATTRNARGAAMAATSLMS